MNRIKIGRSFLFAAAAALVGFGVLAVPMAAHADPPSHDRARGYDQNSDRREHYAGGNHSDRDRRDSDWNRRRIESERQREMERARERRQREFEQARERRQRAMEQARDRRNDRYSSRPSDSRPRDWNKDHRYPNHH